mmetsp:Transcript_21625/g.54328  ORF Transcript_21625/g.54328 Transcript_21625/m.54328 type:complete len:264 (-) Transcript_21625:41-832(-)|eukprot:CAMPEP_0173441116 /NCGR_PEP_ID=MMETSP1357-20121228/23784_1 /TAXON_ID=77926 /ORGANISM="Hemiselmis rufescens, Strain PCC563" /LENGTH=263 /DNA_ID=CAMNT_0014406671 /DNA_START=50 /DNA_END=841 /DNA_ORIENTATION=+
MNLSCILLLTTLLSLSLSALGDTAQCSHTFPNGQTFDLSGLRRPYGQRDWYADDRNGNMYYFNVCGDANEVPEACVDLQKSVQAPVFEVTNESDCFWLGQLRSMEWELIDENEPAAGIELYYFDGEQCGGGRARDVRIQFFCDPDAGVGKPLDYYVLEEDCHYSVTWPSKYGCPVSSSSTVGWSFVWWFFAAVSAYILLGSAYNVHYQGATVSTEALPHLEFWREVPALVIEGVRYCQQWVARARGGQLQQYEKVDGVEYEWG